MKMSDHTFGTTDWSAVEKTCTRARVARHVAHTGIRRIRVRMVEYRRATSPTTGARRVISCWLSMDSSRPSLPRPRVTLTRQSYQVATGAEPASLAHGARRRSPLQRRLTATVPGPDPPASGIHPVPVAGPRPWDAARVRQNRALELHPGDAFAVRSNLTAPPPAVPRPRWRAARVAARRDGDVRTGGRCARASGMRPRNRTVTKIKLPGAGLRRGVWRRRRTCRQPGQ